MTAKKEIPTTEQIEKEIPNSAQAEKELPTPQAPAKEKPSAKSKQKPLPDVGLTENMVTIGGTVIEIKPTKLKYQRNRTAAFYKLLELYPLTDIMAMEEGTFGDDRDGDKATMDWLIAATDNEQLIVDNYDDIDTETIEKILKIFKRINRIDEKEDRLKNMEKERREVGK